jgi:hypothetical protein
VLSNRRSWPKRERRTGGHAAAEQARLLRREGAAAEPDDVRDVDDGVLGEAGDGQEAVDGLAGGGEREARGAVARHEAGPVRQRGADVAAGGEAVGALAALRQEHRHHRVARGHLLHMVPDALHHAGNLGNESTAKVAVPTNSSVDFCVRPCDWGPRPKQCRIHRQWQSGKTLKVPLWLS